MMEYPSHEEARAAGLVSRRDLTEYQWIHPDLAPVACVAGEPCWPRQVVEPLKTRRAWKRLDRHVGKGQEPVSTAGVEGPRLYAKSQTISGEEQLVHRQEGVLVHFRQWLQDWRHWLAAVAEWQERFMATPGPQAEGALQDLFRQWLHLSGRWNSFPQELLPAEEVAHLSFDVWSRLFERYLERRYAVLLEEIPAGDADLAEMVDRALRATEAEPVRGQPMPLMPYWAYYGRFHKEMEAARLSRDVAEATRIHHFHLLFPARELRRHFTLYLGPTNSGKTYQALRRLAEVKTGIYLAPLRLLALEVAETLNQWGVPCHMITGEERIMVPGANHVASTVEMLPLNKRYDLCVIDETQMLGDTDRGWAWTQAILGVMADEVCLLGAPEARPVLETLLELTRDPCEVVNLERLSPLHFLEKPVKLYEELEPGTAVVAFSRAAVLGIKDEIERHTGKRAAVLYGALPPEVRREQARLFASGEMPYLAATDAIGMGLNLPIKTLLFAQERKMIDRQEVALTPMEVRQIAGRAGRFGKNEVGYVGVFRIGMQAVRDAFHRTPPVIRHAHLAPNLDHLLAIAGLQERRQPALSRLLSLFLHTVKPDPHIYRLSSLEDQMVLARIADRFKEMALETRFHLSAAPVPLSSAPAVAAYVQMVETVAAGQSRPLEFFLPDDHGRGVRLESLETTMRIVNLYSWLHYRFADNFPDLESATWKRREINRGINGLLAQARSRGPRTCNECQKPLALEHRFAICDDCWRKGRATRGQHRWRRPHGERQSNHR